MEPGPRSTQDPENLGSILCFFLFGLLTMVYDDLFLVAAQDLLSGSFLSTGVVILLNVGPILSVKMLVPWVMQHVQYRSKLLAIWSLSVVGLVLIVATNPVHWRLLGVILVELSFALGEVTFLALTAFYREITVQAFACGFGSASLIGPLYYTGKSQWTPWRRQ